MKGILAGLLVIAGAMLSAQRQDYPVRPAADPAVVERGKALYSLHCAFCHGQDARGGDSGPSLLRSQLVLNDQNGELIGEVVRNGRPGTAMAPINLTNEQIVDVATFLHSFRVGGYDISRMRPPSIVVGDAEAGKAVFQSKCASCHSVTGDLKGFGARSDDARVLQQAWLMPSNAGGRGSATSVSKVSPTTVTVTTPNGQKVQGELVRIDDFIVTMRLNDGTPRSFTRNGDVPKVELNDPLKPHRDLLPKYTDKEIHDLTAFLVTVK